MNLEQYPSSAHRSTSTQLVMGAAVSMSFLALSWSHLPRSTGTQLAPKGELIQEAVVSPFGEALSQSSTAKYLPTKPPGAAVSMSGVQRWPSHHPPSVGTQLHMIVAITGCTVTMSTFLLRLLPVTFAPGQRPSPAYMWRTHPSQSQLARHPLPRRPRHHHYHHVRCSHLRRQRRQRRYRRRERSWR